MNIIFMGTADFSSTVLERLNRDYKISAVVTGLDKVIGRGQKVVFSAVKEKAIELNLSLLQFEKVSRDGIDEIKKLNPDIIVTAAFGQILSDEFLAIPKIGTLNVHASLLPKYRGSSPIQSAILNGDSITGVTIMKTVGEVDAGDILLSKELKIENIDTADTLFERLSVLGGEAICEGISLIEKGEEKFTPQDSSKATFCKFIKKEDGVVDFNKTIFQIDCLVRAYTSWPSAFTRYQGKTLKIFNVEDAHLEYVVYKNFQNGEIVKANTKDGLVVRCADGFLRLNIIQAENSKRMDAKDYLRGHKMKEGEVLGD